MLGKNSVVTKEDFDKKQGFDQLLVNSVFYTIQGEGPDAGLPAVFVRLAMCNLRCYFCDTEFERGETMSICDVVFKIQEATPRFNRLPLVVITGGEPFLQQAIFRLVHELNMRGYCVSFETAGTVWDPFYLNMVAYKNNKVICSPKTPVISMDLEPYVTAFKYVVGIGRVSEEDGLPNATTQREVPGLPASRSYKIYRPKRPVPIYISPMDERNEERNDANRKLAAALCMQFGYRLSLQMHKIVGVP